MRPDADKRGFLSFFTILIKVVGYEILPHTADLRLRVTGETLQEFFRDALRGMFAVMRPRIAAQKSHDGRTNHSETRHVYIKADDKGALLVDFLNEALLLGDVHDEAYEGAQFQKLQDTEVEAELVGRKRESVGLEVKAATLHGLHIGGWGAVSCNSYS